MHDLLKTFIEKQGWSFYGVTSIQEVQKNLKKSEKTFDEWVKKGYQAEMDWLLKMKKDRFHPENKLADVKSVIVLGAVYSASLKSQVSSEFGVVARYAGGRDYHKVLKKQLVELADFLKTQNSKFPPKERAGETRTYCSVDSGPTVDRVLAEVAGLGFFGKNSMIINPSKGSYFFIASLYTNLELMSTSKKLMPNCGDCTKCAIACPTGALKKPGVIDANLCISYLTIENKEGIPEKLRSQIGDRLFGCDVCQEVCSFNIGRAHKQEIKIENLKTFHGVGNLINLRELLSIRTDEEFLNKFAGTPLMRAKRRGLIRNACVVAGNSGNKELVPHLKKVIERESDKMLKEHARWAIDQLSRKQVRLCHLKESKESKIESSN